MNVPGFQHARVSPTYNSSASWPKGSTARPVNTYADAVAEGNPMLVLSEELRRKIFFYVFVSDVKEGEIVAVGSKTNFTQIRWLPSLCRASLLTFQEAVPVYLEMCLFKISSFAEAYNLHQFLTMTNEFRSVRRLCIDLKLLNEVSNAAGLLQKCPNLREVRVSGLIRAEETGPFADRTTYHLNDLSAIKEGSTFAQMFQLEKVRMVEFLHLEPARGDRRESTEVLIGEFQKVLVHLGKWVVLQFWEKKRQRIGVQVMAEGRDRESLIRRQHHVTLDE